MIVKYKRMKKKSSQRKNIKLEVSNLWGRSRGARRPRKIVSGSCGGRRGPGWGRIGSGFGWSGFIIGHLVQEVEIQFKKSPSHLLLAKFENLDEGVLAELDL